MAREKFKTLTEQMYYTLLALQQARCGVDVMDAVRQMTEERIKLGPGTLYVLLGDFQKAGLIKEVESEGSKKSYILTDEGREKLKEEHERLELLVADFKRLYKE